MERLAEFNETLNETTLFAAILQSEHFCLEIVSSLFTS